MLESLIDDAHRRGASDLHLEAGVPVTLRVRGKLVMLSVEPPTRAVLEQAARELVDADWDAFLTQRSFDLSRTIRGVRCRINVLTSMRGVGLAVRLLPAARPSLERLNLHPDLQRFAQAQHGLVVICGPTGCGKSSTVAALVEELNQNEPRHIITLEDPIEHLYRPRRAFIRQREVGRDTPSFQQGLIDALREDPDVIVVGELREASTMQLALNAAETGHLVLTTLHSSSTAEALQRMVMAFPAEIQGGVAAQLGDCLVGVICQRLRYRSDIDLRIPECEVLWATSGVRGLVRQSGFSRLISAIEGGGADGMFTFSRYGAWIERRRDWYRPDADAGQPVDDDDTFAPSPAVFPPSSAGGARGTGAIAAAAAGSTASPRGRPLAQHPTPRAAPTASRSDTATRRVNVSAPAAPDADEGLLEIGAGNGSLDDIMRELEHRGTKR